MQPALFIIYLLLFCFIINIIPFFKNSGIGRSTLILLFNIKILAAFAYAKYYSLPKNFANADTWRYYKLSLAETKMLIANPSFFIKDLFIYGYTSTGNIFRGENTYWNDLKSNIPIKLMAVFNVVAASDYYTNIILFNFLFLFGLVALYKVFVQLYPSKKRIIIYSLFLLPSTLFWCSGIHKDGLILSALGMIIYCCHNLIIKKKLLNQLLIILISGLLIFSLRNYLLFALLPALFCWGLSENYKQKKYFIFFTVYLLVIVCIFLIPYFLPSINLPAFLTGKQEEFLQLASSSVIKTSPLQPTFYSFITHLPHAIDMAFFRPHINEFKNYSYLPSIIENIILLLLIVLSIFTIKRSQQVTPFVLHSLAFSISILLICGYTIPSTGAIIRYKSVVLPLLITPLLCMGDFSFSKRSLFKLLTILPLKMKK